MNEGSGKGVQLSFFQLDDPVLSQVRDEILNTDINNLTPMAALNKLNDIKAIITGKRGDLKNQKFYISLYYMAN